MPYSDARSARYDPHEARALEGLARRGPPIESLPSLRASPPTPSEIFRLRAEARATLWAAGELDLHEAVDPLQHDAVESGLVASIGQDAVQAIMSAAFARVRP